MVWGPAWAAVRGLEGVAADNSVAITGFVSERLAPWPGDGAEEHAGSVPEGTVLQLVTEDPQSAGQFAESLGFRPAGALVLLTAQTDDLEQVPSLPADAYVAEAPMENYEAVEVALFDRPVAGGRIKLAEGLAVLGGLHVDDGHGEREGVFEQAMAAALAEEAFLHGADVLFLVSDAAQAERFAAVDGWSKAADILTFTR
ncbi:hypothetical protein CVV68_00810 [Arthrobacter livingstonensis]|uniref:Uncharacterized protein n=2 Tax=Arthrobacter livingstonensis TaxID=670078 RepID=A0A2V5LHQ8_9MICC|nr:hypothetical protein CVV68_00810 [Arthrobacter livingstonensis]